MQRIKTINIQLPDLSGINRKDNEDLFSLLGQLENINFDDKILESNIKNLFPKLKIVKGSVSSPRISFITNEDISKSWNAGNLVFGFNLPDNKKSDSVIENHNIAILKDSVGDYIEIDIKGEKFYALTFEQLLQRFNGKFKELNHVGMNFGPKILEKQEYLDFKKLLFKRCNLYNYPTGEEWPFIIPSTKDEFNTDITDESVNRNPKFEITYSEHQINPIIQIDIETNLTKEEVFELLPEPYGVSLEGLEEFYRTVYMHTNWNNVFVRLDLRFKFNGKDHGYWLIKEGKRIKND